MPQIDEIQEIDYSELFSSHKSSALTLRKKPLKERRKKLKAMRQWIFEHKADLEQAVFEDLGKPPEEVNVTEIYPVIAELKHAIKNLNEWASPQHVPGSLAYFGTSAYTQYEPLGTSLIIAPWNYPVLLALGPVISSMAAGNTVILKPSEYTPATNKLLRALIEALYDANEITMVEGEAREASGLLIQPFDHIFFTGSPAVGKIVMAAAAKNLTSVTLELGGKSPTIVDQTANLKTAAKRIAWGKWTNAGQTCVAPDYIFVHRSKLDAFVAEIKEQTNYMYSEKAHYASIINARHFDRVSELISDALSKGARVILSGKQADNVIDPVILLNVTDDMRIMQEEIFGPVLPIKTYDNLEEVIDFINDRPKPLALYHYSQSQRLMKQVLSETSSGAVVFNDSVLQFGHPHLPMGGVNNSGIGKAHGEAGFRAFSHGKAVLKQRFGFSIASMVYPPYNTFKKTLIELMLKYF
ncbi:MAG: aldehyde dehydrogenase family protein [Marinoscillum sp.]